MTNRWTKGAKAAYTLVEILIVVLVLIIAAAIVIPSIGTAADSQAVSAAQVMQSTLEAARSLALTTQAPHSVVFSPDLKSFKVVANYTGVPYASAVAVAHPVQVGKLFEITPATMNGMSSVRITSAAFGENLPYVSYVTFFSLGDPSASGSVTIQAGRTTMVVSVENLTGIITVTRTAG